MVGSELSFPVSTLLLGTGLCLVLLGLGAALLHRNILRLIIGLSLIDSGLAVVIVALGYVRGGTAPIVDAATDATTVFVDPVNAALAVTAIVIGFAVTSVALAYAIRLYRLYGTLDVDRFGDSRG